MCECLDYEDGTRHTCEACVDDQYLLRMYLREAYDKEEALKEKIQSLRSTLSFLANSILLALAEEALHAEMPEV